MSYRTAPKVLAPRAPAVPWWHFRRRWHRYCMAEAQFCRYHGKCRHHGACAHDTDTCTFDVRGEPYWDEMQRLAGTPPGEFQAWQEMHYRMRVDPKQPFAPPHLGQRKKFQRDGMTSGFWGYDPREHREKKAEAAITDITNQLDRF